MHAFSISFPSYSQFFVQMVSLPINMAVLIRENNIVLTAQKFPNGSQTNDLLQIFVR